MKKIYCCRDCGDKISYPTAIYGKGRCNSCAKQGSLNPRIGKTFSDASKEKISKALKGKFSGRKSHLYIDGRSSKQYYCKDCYEFISKRSGLYGKGRCPSCCKLGKNNPNWQNGSSKLIKYSCECTPAINIRVAVSNFSATCNACKKEFKQS